MYISRLLLGALSVIPLGPLASHEYWIDAQNYQVAQGSAIRADFKNGQNFAGSTYSYFDRSSDRFDWMMDGVVTAVTVRSGDKPALQMDAPRKDGLMVVVYETNASTVSYKSWDKFATFIAHKDFTSAEADHDAAGWPRDGFKETYTRHVKTLIGVGTSEGKDTVLGLATEFVALSNPYAQDFDGEMKVQLFYGDALRKDAQVEVFERSPDGTVKVTLHRTDNKGEASIPVLPDHVYLFDAVVLRSAANAGDTPEEPLWETLWAALTFAVPQ